MLRQFVLALLCIWIHCLFPVFDDLTSILEVWRSDSAPHVVMEIAFQYNWDFRHHAFRTVCPSPLHSSLNHGLHHIYIQIIQRVLLWNDNNRRCEKHRLNPMEMYSHEIGVADSSHIIHIGELWAHAYRTPTNMLGKAGKIYGEMKKKRAYSSNNVPRQ